MANVCTVCEKKSMVGGRYSNRVRATKFNPIGNIRRYPNLQWATLADGSRTKMCTRCKKAGKHLIPVKVKKAYNPAVAKKAVTKKAAK